MNTRRFLTATLLGGATALVPALSAAGDLDELREQVEAQQGEIQELRSQLDATASMVERKGGGHHGSRGATTIGGYGELHYNKLDSKSELDFHRFVLFFGHEFSDSVRFHSEVELEHSLAGEGKPGEVELEQAYVEFDLNDRHRAKAGLFLVPVGILNETHEPPTFYGVERNPVEKDIIPTTWWEGGAGLSGELAPALGYDFTVTSGLDVPTSGSKAYKIRDGRQKVAGAVAEELAYTARLKWTGLAGVELAGSVQYQDDITQGAEGVSAILLEAHAVVSQGPFGLRALYAAWDLDGDGPAAAGRDEQSGWYIEPSYKITPKLGVFARYSAWDNDAGASTDTEKAQMDFGVNFWPHENVVLKADFQNQDDAADDDGYNLGVGYHF